MVHCVDDVSRSPLIAHKHTLEMGNSEPTDEATLPVNKEEGIAHEYPKCVADPLTNYSGKYGTLVGSHVDRNDRPRSGKDGELIPAVP